MSVMRTSLAVFITLLCLNTAALVAWRRGLLSEDVFRPFWSSSTSAGETSVAELSDRITGVFNQPYEAGVTYSFGLAACIYLVQTEKIRKRRTMLVIGFAVLSVGIVIVASKALVYGALVLIVVNAVHYFRDHPFSSTVRALKGAAIVVLSVSLVAGGSEFTGRGDSKLSKYVDSLSSFNLLGITGGRGSPIDQVTGSRAIGTLTGYGYSKSLGIGSPIAGPLDSGAYAAVLGAGLFGLTLYGFMLILILGMARSARGSGWLSTFVSSICWLIFLLQFGGPVLYVNRAGSMAWVLLCLCSAEIDRRAQLQL